MGLRIDDGSVQIPDHRFHQTHLFMLPRFHILLAGQPAQDQIAQQTDRAEQKGEEHAGNDLPVGQARPLGIPQLPGPDEEVEGQIVDPPGQNRPFAAEELHHLGQRTKPALRVAKCRHDEDRIADGQQPRDQSGMDQSASPAPAWTKDQQQPADQGDVVGDQKKYLCLIHL